MKKIAASVLLMTSMVACSPASEPPAADVPVSAEAAEVALPADALRHVVVFRFRADAPPEQIQQVTDAFRALKDKIPGILAFEHGVNNSPEGMNMGFTHVYALTFEDAAARDAYLPHPDHAAFGQLLGGLGIHEETFVVDYNPMP